MDLITSHVNADFDAFSSMLAAKKLYPKAELVFPGAQGKKLREFFRAFHPFEPKRIKDIDFSAVKRLIIVDTKSPERIGPLSDLLSQPGLKVHLYDHHPHSEGDIKGDKEVIETVGATVTIFAGIFMEKGIKPTPVEATAMCLGIYEETGCLLFPSVTERDLYALAFLLKNGASLKIVSKYLKTEMSSEELDLLNELLQGSEDMIIHGVKVKTSQASRDKYVGEVAHLAHKIMDMEDVDALVLSMRMQDKILMVGRSRAPELDIAQVLEEFGGGGHPTAASATLRDIPLEVLRERLHRVLKRNVRPGKSARDIMTRPVITVDSKATLKETEGMMTRYGVNVLPVLKKGFYYGTISREIVEKALFHGFRASRVLDFATTEDATAQRDTPIRDVEALMVERNQRFMPVMQDGNLVGAITRTDLLRVLYEDFLKRSHINEEDSGGGGGGRGGAKPSMGKNVASLIREKFPPDVREVLKLSGEIAEGLGQGAYLVGGSVRDLLRGEKNLDIDIVIEGDAIVFAAGLASELGAKVKTHERFGTARIIADKLKFDVATARTEFYESPAALPTVETSSIKKDLYRRDFTFNTLAVKLNPNGFGRLADFFGGQRDLRDKTIRVLHNLSFVEDPTRAFRAVRFAERFGFKLSPHTERLIRSALKMELFERLSGSRLYEELLLTFNETEPLKAIFRLSHYELLGVIHPDIVLDDKLNALLKALNESIHWFNLSFIEEAANQGLLYLMALLNGLDEAGKEAAMKRLSMPEKLCETLTKNIQAARAVVDRLPLSDPADIYAALSGLSLEAVLFAMSLAPEQNKKREISRYLVELRGTRPRLSGHDLKEMGIPPGPVYSSLLALLLNEKLRGNVQSREDEVRFVLRAAREKSE